MESLINSVLGGQKPGPQLADSSDKIRISVVGVGGGGCNTINRLAKMGIRSADTIAINTDATHLRVVEASRKLLIGHAITKGLGAGGFPEVAQKCAEASRDKIREALAGSELVFLSAGMGGGTGTGAAPIIAEVAKEQGAIVVAMVTFPFALERARLEKAYWGLDQLKKTCDTVVIIDNNRLVSYAPNLPMNQAFQLADEIVSKAVKGISDTITFPSLVNIDFADVRAIMNNAGVAMISVGEGKGNDRIEKVVKGTLSNPLLDVDYTGAKGALIHLQGPPSMSLGEATQIGEKLTSAFDDNANVIWGARLTPECEDRVIVTAIMTGISSPQILGKSLEEREPQKIVMGTEDINYI